MTATAAFVLAAPVSATRARVFLRSFASRGRLRQASLRRRAVPSCPTMSAAMPPANSRPPSPSPAPRAAPPSKPAPLGSLRSFLVSSFTLRNRVFLTMLISYATYYLTRYSFPFSAPLMQKSLSLSLQQIGLISSSFPLVYGVSKLFAGMLSDLASPRRILSAGLLLAAVCNVLFASASSVPLFAFFWALNGFVSSVGFPACAKLLSSWFGPEERGTYWGLLNVSLNIGGALSPIIVSSAAATMGWRFGMFVPAAIALVMSLVSYVLISDAPPSTPKSIPSPLPSQSLAQSTLSEEPSTTSQSNGTTGGGKTEDSLNQTTNSIIKHDTTTTKEESEGPTAEEARTFVQQVSQAILRRPAVWALAAAYFFVYVVRHALSTWPVFFLMQARGVSSLAEAAVRVSGLEIGGLLGSVTSGYLSDRLIRRNPEAGAIGQRVRVILLYLAVTACCAGLFFATPGTAALMPVQWGLFALTGLGLYGPQLLVGLCSAECVDKKFAGTSNGFVGLAAYIGAALAGLPLSMAVKKFGWGALYSVVIGCCGIVAALLIPLLRAKSHDQLVASGAAESQ